MWEFPFDVIPTRLVRGFVGSFLGRGVGGLVGFAELGRLILFVEFAFGDLEIAPGHRIVFGLKADGGGEFFGGGFPGLELN